jgi:Uma2 family endonuclease
MATASVPLLTPEEYLAIERQADHRSEYVNGQMFAMAGRSARHARIISNVQATLYNQLEGKGCDVFSSDFRVQSAGASVYTYPDIVVFCSPASFLDDQRDTVTDATLIVEVLSPTTKNYDRGEKFEYYRSLPSFSEYLLVHQDACRVEHYARRADGKWIFQEYSAPSDLIELASLGCTLPLSRVFNRVTFEP